jgi:hypothetical protein
MVGKEPPPPGLTGEAAPRADDGAARPASRPDGEATRPAGGGGSWGGAGEIEGGRRRRCGRPAAGPGRGGDLLAAASPVQVAGAIEKPERERGETGRGAPVLFQTSRQDLWRDEVGPAEKTDNGPAQSKP